MSGTSKLWMALLTVVVWASAATAAHAQGTTTIKAADAEWQPNAVTVPTGSVPAPSRGSITSSMPVASSASGDHALVRGSSSASELALE